jgi:5-methylcytosine-specific restriction endonuclease McrA
MAAIYALDAERFFLGTLCKRNHQWEDSGVSLRYRSDKSCVQCAKDKSLRQSKAGKHAQANARRRQRFGRPSRAKGAEGPILPVGIGLKGNPYGLTLLARGISAENLELAVQEYRLLWNAIRRAGRLPSVAQLVLEAQREYWRDPAVRAEHLRQKNKRYHQWRYTTDVEYRLYHRQKSKRRKALERGSIGIHVKGKQVKARFAQFGHCCAYCGATGDLHIEHVVPISFGGTHVLSNIVPACKSCNFSKRDKDAEGWYRQQPFFCEKRWRKILRVMGTGKGSPQQLALV